MDYDGDAFDIFLYVESAMFGPTNSIPWISGAEARWHDQKQQDFFKWHQLTKLFAKVTSLFLLAQFEVGKTSVWQEAQRVRIDLKQKDVSQVRSCLHLFVSCCIPYFDSSQWHLSPKTFCSPWWRRFCPWDPCATIFADLFGMWITWPGAKSW